MARELAPCSRLPMPALRKPAPISAPESDQYGRGFRRIVVLILSLVTAPTVVLLVVGIVMLVFTRAGIDVILGVLVVAVGLCLVTGTVLVLFYVQRESRLSRLQSDFVSKVSHELKTPLTSIRLFAESLQAGRVSEEDMKECVDALVRETGRLDGRIERLLDWGRMEAGKRIYEPRPEDVGSLVDEALEVFAAANLGHRIAVIRDVDPELPAVLADRPALVEALGNLLGNALKYNEGDPEIALRVRRDGRWVRFDVSDRGIGIEGTEQRRVFQKFYRVDERLSGAAGGFGLGLAIVQHVVRGHGGRVELTSEPGEGSTFSLFLPLATGAEFGP